VIADHLTAFLLAPISSSDPQQNAFGAEAAVQKDLPYSQTKRTKKARCLAQWLAALIFTGLLASSASPQYLFERESVATEEEPITPIPNPVEIDPLKVAIGERLFKDRRLSNDNSRSCSSCHDLGSNGASRKSLDTGHDGSSLRLNTPTLFNAALSFRLGWEGKFRSLNAHTAALLESPQPMGVTLTEVVKRLSSDKEMQNQFKAAYGVGPNPENVVDAIATFEQTLLTPGSRFDRWLAGNRGALSSMELEGYRQFKSLGCVSCHQGVNIGGNLFEQHGIFHPLASPNPAILRVPSLRNVATTPPYFHDGSAPTLDDAVRKMGRAQLNSTLTDAQVEAIVAFLQTLTGDFRGKRVGGDP
jgi:cytochrome c peroxidase